MNYSPTHSELFTVPTSQRDTTAYDGDTELFVYILVYYSFVHRYRELIIYFRNYVRLKNNFI